MSDEDTAETARREAVSKRVGSAVSSLSTKMRTYVIELLVTNNQTEAAARAGYKHPAQAGSRLAKEPKVIAAIDDYFFGPEMDAREVIQRLGQQARAEWTEYLQEDGTVDLAQMIADGNQHLVKGTRQTQWGLVVEFPDQQAALVHVGRYHKLFTDGVDVTSGEKPVPFADIVAAMQRARKAGVDE